MCVHFCTSLCNLCSEAPKVSPKPPSHIPRLQTLRYQDNNQSGTTVGVTCVCVSCDTFTSNQSAKEVFSSSKLICLVSFHNSQDLVYGFYMGRDGFSCKLFQLSRAVVSSLPDSDET